jgi:hypothetical protein
MRRITMTLYYLNSTQTSWKELDGQAVIIHFETTHYYSLNETGTFIWKLLDKKPRSESDILQEVSSQYGRAASEISTDIKNLLKHLVNENLIMEDDTDEQEKRQGKKHGG